MKKILLTLIMLLAGVCSADYKFTSHPMKTENGEWIEIATKLIGFIDEDIYPDFVAGVFDEGEYIFWGNGLSDKIQYESTLLPSVGGLADIDKDELVDIVFDEEIVDKNNVYFRYNLGNREFSAPVLILSVNSSQEWGRLYPSIFDVDGDGNLDLVFYHLLDSCLTNIYWGDENNEFSPDRFTDYYSLNVFPYPWCDVNGDGKADFLTSKVFVQQPDKTFLLVYALPNAIKSRVVVDVNGDGKADIVADFQDGLSDKIVVLLGNGDGTFSAPIELFSEQKDGDDGTDYLDFTLCLCTPADFEGDGQVDLIVTRRYGSIYSHHLLTIDKDLNWEFIDPSCYSEGVVMSFRDFNTDGYPDFTTVGADGWVMYFGDEAESPPPPPSPDEDGGGGGGGCFIATACFGSYDHPFVKVLRQFRDRCLLTNPLGQAFVRWYYRHSPAGAEFLNKYAVLKVPVLICLLPLVFGAYLIFHPYLVVCVVGLWGVIRKEKYGGQKR
ncbi:VCBS repeat-containing protein [Patescibacteria group bacterium]|nr:VCBS repeat-containing protein [Patescibacteria group bacterium]